MADKQAPFDFGRALRFFFEDPKWVTKIILGTLETYDDSLADPSQPDYSSPVGVRKQRVHQEQEERAGDTDPLESLIENPRFQSSDIHRDIGQFRHGVSFILP